MKETGSLEHCCRTQHMECMNPLISVTDLSDAGGAFPDGKDCYSMVLLPFPTDKKAWGWKPYDFTDACLSFHLPNQRPDLENQWGTLLLFHPDLFCLTSLAMRIPYYSFFRYKQEESLHLSCREHRVICQTVDTIRHELQWGVDEYSSAICSNKIELLLLYCQRFYQRQFTTRRDGCSCLYDHAKKAIDCMLLSGEVKTDGIYDATDLAQQLGTSTAYLNDLVKHDTGKTILAYSQLRKIELARQMLFTKRMPEAQIAETLGFPSEEYVRSLFQRLTNQMHRVCRR